MSVTVDPRIGSELAGYRIERVLGRGGMGVVYLAEDLTLARKVALKVLSPELSEDEEFRERFRAEWRLAASIDHPNVIPIHEAGDYDGTLFIAMRYVEGTDLKKLIAEEGGLEPARAVALVSHVAEGLDAAHTRGLVHRDVKPSNVLIAREGEKEHAYLADFGLTKPASSEATARESIALSGSYDYVSPEQITDGTADGASDVYALGAVLYEALTGRVTFPHERKLQTLFAHVNDEPPAPSQVDPGVPDGLDAVVATALAKEPEDRYGSGAELAQAAMAALPTSKRSRRQLGALVVMLALLLAVTDQRVRHFGEMSFAKNAAARLRSLSSLPSHERQRVNWSSTVVRPAPSLRPAYTWASMASSLTEVMVQRSERIADLEQQLLEVTTAFDDRVAAEKYVAAAFIIVFVVVLLWLVLHLFRVRRLEQELGFLHSVIEDAGLLEAPRGPKVEQAK